MDHFARFGFEPKPWIDSEQLKQKFLDLSAETHPDKVLPGEKAGAEQRFQEINQAYNILRNTRARLLHLLELTKDSKLEPVQNVPAAALELFPEVAAATKRAEVLSKEKRAATSPMLQVQLMEKALPEIDAMQGLQARIRGKISVIEEGLLGLAWSPAPSVAAIKLAQDSAAALGFLERWNAQLQERIGALTF